MFRAQKDALYFHINGQDTCEPFRLNLNVHPTVMLERKHAVVYPSNSGEYGPVVFFVCIFTHHENGKACSVEMIDAHKFAAAQGNIDGVNFST